MEVSEERKNTVQKSQQNLNNGQEIQINQCQSEIQLTEMQQEQKQHQKSQKEATQKESHQKKNTQNETPFDCSYIWHYDDKLESVNRVRILSNQSKIKRSLPPCKRWGHSAVMHNHEMILFGGHGGSSSLKNWDSVFIFNCITYEWTVVPPSTILPMSRDSHSLVHIKNHLYLFGGSDGESALDELYQFNLNTFNWAKVQCKQQPQMKKVQKREGHCAVALYDRFLLVHGGWDGEQVYAETIVFDTVTKEWSELNLTSSVVPCVRESHTMVLMKQNILYIFGGQGETLLDQDQNVYLNDMHRLTVSLDKQQGMPVNGEWQQVKYGEGEVPEERSGHCAVSVRDRYIIVVGGEGNATPSSHMDNKQNVKVVIRGQNQENERPVCFTKAGIWVFDVESLVWSRLWPQNQHVLQSLFAFSMCLYNDSLLVFGGMVDYDKIVDDFVFVELRDFKSIQIDPLFLANSQITALKEADGRQVLEGMRLGVGAEMQTKVENAQDSTSLQHNNMPNVGGQVLTEENHALKQETCLKQEDNDIGIGMSQLEAQQKQPNQNDMKQELEQRTLRKEKAQQKVLHDFFSDGTLSGAEDAFEATKQQCQQSTIFENDQQNIINKKSSSSSSLLSVDMGWLQKQSEMIQWPFAAIGLLIDNAVLMKAGQISMHFGVKKPVKQSDIQMQAMNGDQNYNMRYLQVIESGSEMWLSEMDCIDLFYSFALPTREVALSLSVSIHGQQQLNTNNNSLQSNLNLDKSNPSITIINNNNNINGKENLDLDGFNAKNVQNDVVQKDNSNNTIQVNNNEAQTLTTTTATNFCQNVNKQAKKQISKNERSLYGNNLKTAGLRLGDTLVFASRNDENEVCLALLSSRSLMYSGHKFAVFFVIYNVITQQYKTQNGVQQRKNILDALRTWFTEEDLVPRQPDTRQIIMLNLKKEDSSSSTSSNSASVNLYEMSYNEKQKDVYLQKPQLFHLRNTHLHNYIDFSLKQYLRHFFFTPPVFDSAKQEYDGLNIFLNEDLIKYIDYKIELSKNATFKQILCDTEETAACGFVRLYADIAYLQSKKQDSMPSSNVNFNQPCQVNQKQESNQVQNQYVANINLPSLQQNVQQQQQQSLMQQSLNSQLPMQSSPYMTLPQFSQSQFDHLVIMNNAFNSMNKINNINTLNNMTNSMCNINTVGNISNIGHLNNIDLSLNSILTQQNRQSLPNQNLQIIANQESPIIIYDDDEAIASIKQGDFTNEVQSQKSQQSEQNEQKIQQQKEMHNQGILIYFDNRLLSRYEQQRLGLLYLHFLKMQSKMTQPNLKYSGFVQLNSQFFIPNLIFTDIEQIRSAQILYGIIHNHLQDGVLKLLEERKPSQCKFKSDNQDSYAQDPHINKQIKKE